MTNPTEKVIINPTEKLRERIIGLFMQFGTDVKRAKHPSPIEYLGEILKACKEAGLKFVLVNILPNKDKAYEIKEWN